MPYSNPALSSSSSSTSAAGAMMAMDPKQEQQHLQQFEQMIITTTSSANNQHRQLAEQTLNNTSMQQPQLFVHLLVTLMRQSQQLNVRMFCAVMMRTYMKPTHPLALWSKLTSAVQQRLKVQMLDAMMCEPQHVVSSKVADAVGMMANCVFTHKGTWDELLPALVKFSHADTESVRTNAFNALTVVAEFQPMVVTPYLAPIKDVLAANLRASVAKRVRTAAIKATCSVILSLPEGEREHMQDLVPMVFISLGQSCAEVDDYTIRDVLEILIDWVRSVPKFFSGHCESIVELMFQIAAAPQLEGGTRRVAMSFLLDFLECGKGMVRAVRSFALGMVRLAMQFLVRIGEDDVSLEEWAAETNENDTMEMEDLSMGRESIDRLAGNLGGKVFLQHAIPAMTQMLGADEWQQRHAAVFCIGEMTDGCSKQLKDQLPGLVGALVDKVATDPHVRVRWAALSALASVALDFKKTFQHQFHNTVMPLLASLMTATAPRRLVRAAIMCAVDVVSHMEDETLFLYLDSLMQALMVTLNLDAHTQEVSFALLSVTVGIADDAFTPYYDVFMPFIVRVLEQARDTHLRLVRGRAMESVGMICTAVGAEKFGPDSERIMRILLGDQRGGLKSDDPQYVYMIEALVRVCRCMQQRFVPYLDFCIPPLLETAAQTGAFVLREGETHPLMDDESFKTETIDVRGVEKVKLLFNSDIIHDQSAACNMLYEYASMLGAGFYKYVEQTARIMIPLVKVRYNESIRVAAMATIPCLIKCINLHTPAPAPPVLQQQIWEASFPAFVECFCAEVELSALEGVLSSFQEVIEALPFPPARAQVDTLHNELDTLIRESVLRRSERELVRNDPHFDEEMEEELMLDNEVEDGFLGTIGNLIIELAKTCKEAYMAPFNANVHPLLAPFMDPAKCAGERCMALCVYSEVLLHCGDGARAYLEPYLRACLAMHTDDDIDVAQSVYFGLGVCARVATAQQFAPVLGTVLQILIEAVQHPEARSEEREPATDNAVSVLGKLCLLYPDAVGDTNASSIVSMWLDYLPIKGDELEGRSVHNDLCTFVERGHPVVMANLTKVICVFADMLQTETTTEEVTARALNIWKSMQQGMDAASLQTLWRALTPKQRKKLEKAVK